MALVIVAIVVVGVMDLIPFLGYGFFGISINSAGATVFWLGRIELVLSAIYSMHERIGFACIEIIFGSGAVYGKRRICFLCLGVRWSVLVGSFGRGVSELLPLSAAYWLPLS